MTPGLERWIRPALRAFPALALVAAAGAVQAADHNEAPATKADPAADITDLYAWTDDDKLIAVINWTFAAPMSDQVGTFDTDVIFMLHIDNDADNLADIDVVIRYGENAQGEIGMKVENMPGTDAPVIGPVETNVDAGGGLMAFSGLRDDPFFFDLEGFVDTLETGTLALDSGRDSFAGQNVTSAVLMMDLDSALGSGTSLQVWATSARKGA